MSEDDRAAFARAVANYDTAIDPRKELLRCADTIDRLTRERDEARDDATRRHREMMDAIDAEIAMEARAERAEAEADRWRANAQKNALAHIEAQREAAGRYGMNPGELQTAWRRLERTDRQEIEWAICDALAMGGIASYPGDGVGCAAKIVEAQMDRAERAEAALKRIVDKRGYADDPWAIPLASLAQKDAASRPATLTLKDFGYAPGNYTIRCMDCYDENKPFREPPSGDKRAWRCEHCAQKRLDAALAQKDGDNG